MVARHGLMRMLLAVCVSIGTAHAASAQPIGTFRFQLQPFCNTVTLTVVQAGEIFTLDGFDDQCSASTRASVVGTAFFNPDASIGIGLTTIATPGGGPVHTDVALSLSTLGGPWRDSAGNSGTLVFNPGAVGGQPRPVPVAAALVPASRFRFAPDGGLVASGEFGTGAIGAEGAGTRLVWYPGKASFRAGTVSGTQWNNATIGAFSVGFGTGTTASGSGSVATGIDSTASGTGSVAMGFASTATGDGAVALGHSTKAAANGSTAVGWNTSAGGAFSLAGGFDVSASGLASVALGSHASTNGRQGAFVYSDTSNAAFTYASADNQFTVRAAGGTRFFSNSTATMGVKLEPNGGAWTNASDAALKRDFRDLDGEAVLSKLRAMPIREWSYISQDPAIRHVGPTAQDFHAAFALGEDPRGITTIDADGVALRAIQALEARTSALVAVNQLLGSQLAIPVVSVVEPVAFTLCTPEGPGATQTCTALGFPASYTVPPGKRLIIEQLAGSCGGDADQDESTEATIVAQTAGVIVGHPIGGVLLPPGSAVRIPLTLTRIYADPQSVVTIGLTSVAAFSNRRCWLRFSGQLVKP